MHDKRSKSIIFPVVGLLVVSSLLYHAVSRLPSPVIIVFDFVLVLAIVLVIVFVIVLVVVLVVWSVILSIVLSFLS